MKIYLSLISCLIMGITLSATPEVVSSDPVGTWSTLVKGVPDMGDIKGTMTISKSGNSFSVMLASDAGSAPLSNVQIKDNKITGQIDIQGVILKLSGTFTNNEFKGRWESEFGVFTITGQKQ